MSTTLMAPGPKARLLTGHLADMRKDILSLFTRCAREYGDVASIRMGFERALIISHPRLIEQVLVTNARNFTKSFGTQLLRTSFGDGLLTSEGDFWLRQRRLIQPAFGHERISTYAPVMVERSGNLTAKWRDGETRDIYADMTRLTLEVIARVMFGADVSKQAIDVGESVSVLADWVTQRINSIIRPPTWIPTPANMRRNRAAQRIDAILYDIIRQRRNRKEIGNDLLGILIRVCDESDGGQMTDLQLRDEAFTLFVAGHDTTALTLAWGLYLLAHHPEAAQALEKELDSVLGTRQPNAEDLARLPYTNMVVREVMRLYPSAYAIGRQAIAPCDVDGYHVPAGGKVLMSQWVVHRDPRWYQDPEQFIPERWANGLERRLPRFAYFPFGGGPRVCIGNHFALMEASLILASIARAWRVSVPPGEMPVLPKPRITLRPSGPVRLTVHARRTSSPLRPTGRTTAVESFQEAQPQIA
jgi:cytochrome P450